MRDGDAGGMFQLPPTRQRRQKVLWLLLLLLLQLLALLLRATLQQPLCYVHRLRHFGAELALHEVILLLLHDTPDVLVVGIVLKFLVVDCIKDLLILLLMLSWLLMR